MPAQDQMSKKYNPDGVLPGQLAFPEMKLEQMNYKLGDHLIKDSQDRLTALVKKINDEVTKHEDHLMLSTLSNEALQHIAKRIHLELEKRGIV